jgi:hypothetical protein
MFFIMTASAVRSSSLGLNHTISVSARSLPGCGRAGHTFAELLIDCEENRVVRAVWVGML